MHHKDLLTSISPRASLEFLARMIRFQSYSGTPGESELAHFMVDAMKGLGLEAFVQPVEGDRVNAIGRWRGSGGGKSIMFNGHLDTNPVTVSPRVVNSARSCGPALPKALELLIGDTKLTEDLVKERRADLSPTVQGEGHGAAIWMVPAFVASSLPEPDESETRRHHLELPGGGARHSRFR